MPKRQAKEVMTKDVITVASDWPIKRLTRFLIENSITGAPVVGLQNEVLGVVSLTDIAHYLNITGSSPGLNVDNTHDYFMPAIENEYGAEIVETLHIEAPETVSVKDIMTPLLFTVDENASVKQVADVMVKGRIHRLLVTKDNRLVGIISSLDLLEIVRDMP
ncbi:CBS domain-containing protein [bacterium]|nr:CBS domain-containing protein [bacterium]